MAKKEPDKIKGTSLDISEENRVKLKQLFPTVFTETKNDKGELVKSIDFEKLKAELGTFSDVFESRRERYGMDWSGKKEALRLIQTPSYATLKPCREESVNFDSTENLFIEGDNLEVLKLLQKSYYGKIKMIYIDPPYNTGNEFIYPDNYTESLETYLEYAGLIDSEGKKFSTNNSNEGRFHTKWINMMYPRLYLARNLLQDDGVIFISIDDNEVSNLRKICDEIFGEENFVAEITRITKKGGNKGTFVKPKKDYVLFYFKNKSVVSADDIGDIIDIDPNEKWMEEEFQGKRRRYKRGDIPYREKLEVRANQRYYIEAPDGSLIIPPGTVFPKIRKDAELIKPESEADKCWSWSRTRYLQEKENDRFIFIKSDKAPFLDEKGNPAKWSIYKKVFEEELSDKREILTDFLDQFENSKGTKEVGDLEIPFDYPKPSELISHLARLSSGEDSIVLDFFAGSCPSAHAVLNLNQDGGNRKFICVQLPEPCDKESEAFNAGYRTIADIGKERIRRVIKKLNKEQESNLDLEQSGSQDRGFKVLKLDKSNIKQWQKLEPSTTPEKIAEQLEFHIEYIDNKATPEDLLYEILLKSGFTPIEKIETKTIDGKKVFSIAEGALLLCLESEVTKELIDAVAESEPMQFICLDSAFHGNDQLKANAVQTFAARNIQKDKHNQIIFKTV